MLSIHFSEYHSFPWTFRLANFQCYTLRKDSRKNLIRKVDLTATIDIATKPVAPDVIDHSLAGFGLCVYVDTSPVIISLSEDQVRKQKSYFSSSNNALECN